MKKLLKKGGETSLTSHAKNCTFEEDRMRKKMRAMEAARYRRGDEHPGAALTDAEVDLVRELNESGWSYSALADKFEVSKSTIAGICQCRRRA